MKRDSRESNSTGKVPVRQVRDVSNRDILKDPVLCIQFLKDYVDENLFKDLKPEDIEDEMSLLMMLGKAQTPEDIQRLLNTEREQIQKIIDKAPKHILELIASTVWSLCMKMNVSQNEAKQCVRKVRERQMGYWFENMEKMDIQAERRNTAEARAELKKARQELEKSKKISQENTICSIVSICQELGASKETTMEKIQNNCHLDQKTAEEKVNLYWKNNG